MTPAQVLDDDLNPVSDLIAYSWHPALFAITKGDCVDRPARARG